MTSAISIPLQSSLSYANRFMQMISDLSSSQSFCNTLPHKILMDLHIPATSPVHRSPPLFHCYN